MANNKLLRYPDDFSYIQKDTAEEIHIKEVQEMIDKAISETTVPVVIIQEGDTIVIRADDRVIVSRAYYINKKSEPMPISPAKTDIDKTIN